MASAIEDLYADITRNQFKLMTVADRRTATMVHVNATMISLVVALLFRHIDAHPHLLVPTLLLLAANPVGMTRDQYRDQMERLTRDLPALLKRRLDATYFIRRMLSWRAQMLRLTYDVFLGGFFLAVFAFVIAPPKVTACSRHGPCKRS